ncbi:MAG: hypothetical protein WCW30_02195 [Candidatus Gracilibacteria bacterium]
MHDFTTEDIISYINLCFTLTEEEKDDLKLRVLDELELNGNRLSPELGELLAAVFETEVTYLENHHLPLQDELVRQAEDEYEAELQRIQPQLERLVDDYKKETEELTHEYDVAFRQLDKEFDQIAQKELGSLEEQQILALKQKLAQPKTQANPSASTDFNF